MKPNRERGRQKVSASSFSVGGGKGELGLQK